MKRLFCMVLAVALVLTFAACGGNKTESSTAQEPAFNGDLFEYMDKVMDGTVDAEMVTDTVAVEDDLFSWFFFIEPLEGAESVVCVPMNGSIPFEAGLIRLAGGTENGDEIREEIEQKVDPRKWICVEAEKTAVVRRGNLILLVMGDAQQADKAVSNFMALQ